MWSRARRRQGSSGSATARVAVPVIPRAYVRVPTSGDEQAGAEVGRIEAHELLVALDPPSRGEVGSQGPHRPVLGRRPDPAPHRRPAADLMQQIGLWAPPVGVEEAVHAVPWDQD